MNFFLLDDPAKPAEFARFSHVGTWSGGSLCRECGVPTETLVDPLQIEWNKGTDRIGDFSWCGYHCVVTNEVREFFQQVHAPCAFGRVEVVPPSERTKTPRVSYPYVGPVLSWLMPQKRIPLNEARSGVYLEFECRSCGHKEYNFKRDGLYIDHSAAKDHSMFLIDQFGKSRATFITEPLLAGLKAQGFTNLCARLAGVIDGDAG